MKKFLALSAMIGLMAVLSITPASAQQIQTYSGNDLSGLCNSFPMSNPNPPERYNATTGNYFICSNTVSGATAFAPLWTSTGAPTGTTGSGLNVLNTSPTLVTPALGTPSAINLTNATGLPGGLVTQSIVIPLTLTQLQTLFSVGVQILPTPAATSMYVMGPCVLNLTYGSAAFTGGGAVSLGYGNTFASTTPSPLTHGTVAATVFTTFSASHGVVVIPAAVAVTVTTGLAGKAVFMSAATQDFAAGTGGSGQISCQYSVATGVS